MREAGWTEKISLKTKRRVAVHQAAGWMNWEYSKGEDWGEGEWGLKGGKNS